MSNDLDSRMKDALSRWGLDKVEEREEIEPEPVSPKPDPIQFDTASPFIQSPFMDVEAPLSLVISGNRPYLGALISMNNGECALNSPLLYIERPDRNDRNKLEVGFTKPIMALGIMHILTIRYDSVYLLNSGLEKDIDLARVYVNMVNTITAADSNYSVPSLDDIARYGQKKQ